jgi:hypothetical protein
MDWVRHLAATEDVSLIRIKDRDNRHNSDPDRIASIPDPEKRERAGRRAKSRYAPSMRVLQSALEGLENRPGNAA